MKALSVLICGCWLAALPANASGVTGTVVAHDSGEALGYDERYVGPRHESQGGACRNVRCEN